MTPDMNWKNLDIDTMEPLSLFDKSNDEELEEPSNWKSTPPLLTHIYQQKGIKYIIFRLSTATN